MVSRVEIAPQALADLDGIADYIMEHGGFEQAERWFNGIVDALASLQDMPARCPIADESGGLGEEVRVLLHGRRGRQYGVYFSIHRDTATVRIFHVRHWARKRLGARDLQALMSQLSSRGEA